MAKYNIFSVCVVVLFIIVLGTVKALTCGDAVCGNPTDNCCVNDYTGAQTCYDPALYSCYPITNGTQLCSSQEAPCEKSCYNASLYKCCNGELYGINNQANCPQYNSTNPPPAVCTTASCGVGLSCCSTSGGPACYPIQNFTCTYVESSGNYVLCGLTEYEVLTTPCGPWCYDSNLYYCCNEVIYQNNGASPCTERPPTISPTLMPTPAYTNDLNATDLYQYYLDDYFSSSITVLDIATAYPFHLYWYANRVQTINNDLVAIFNGDFSNVEASVEVTWSGNGPLEITQTSCTVTSYSNCDTTDTWSACWFPSDYYNQQVCPCSECSVVAAGYGGAPTYGSTTTTSGGSTFFYVGTVSSPLTISLAPHFDVQAYIDIYITGITLHFV